MGFEKLGKTSVMLAAILVLGLGLPGLAGAEEGRGFVVAKTTEQVSLANGTVLEVSPLTRIVSAEGRRMTLGELQVAPMDGPSGFQALPEAFVSYQGRRTGSTVETRSIRVLGILPQ